MPGERRRYLVIGEANSNRPANCWARNENHFAAARVVKRIAAAQRSPTSYLRNAGLIAEQAGDPLGRLRISIRHEDLWEN